MHLLDIVLSLYLIKLILHHNYIANLKQMTITNLE